MKRAARTILLLSLAIAGALLPAAAQDTPQVNQTYTWPAATTGTSNAQLGKYLIINGVGYQRQANETLDVTVTGTTPATCTFRVEGSADGTAWYGLDVTSPATVSCTTNYMESIVNRPVQLLRILLTYTQGDATTKVVFHYTGGRS